jgi:hypothetical protein
MKRTRQNEKRRVANRVYRTSARTHIKKARRLIEAGDLEQAEEGHHPQEQCGAAQIATGQASARCSGCPSRLVPHHEDYTRRSPLGNIPKLVPMWALDSLSKPL